MSLPFDDCRKCGGYIIPCGYHAVSRNLSSRCRCDQTLQTEPLSELRPENKEKWVG